MQQLQENYPALTLGWCALFCAGVLLALQFMLIKFMETQNIPPGFSIAIANLFAVAIIFPCLYIRGVFFATSLYIMDNPRTYILGFFSGLMNLSLSISVVSIGAGNASALFLAFAAIYTLFEWCYRSARPKAPQVLALVLALSGAICIARPAFIIRLIFNGEEMLGERAAYVTSEWGYLWILISAISAAFLLKLSYSFNRDFGTHIASAVCVMGNCVVASLFSCFTEKAPDLNTSQLPYILSLTGAVLLGTIFVTGACVRLPISHQIIVLSFEPVYAYGLGFVLFIEKPGILAIIGAVQMWASAVILGLQNALILDDQESENVDKLADIPRVEGAFGGKLAIEGKNEYRVTFQNEGV